MTSNYSKTTKDIEVQYSEGSFIFNNRRVELQINFAQTGNLSPFAEYVMALTYNPQAPTDEKWRPYDNGHVTIYLDGNVVDGEWLWRQFMYYINCDFELDIAELYDYHEWFGISNTFDYEGKVVKLKSVDQNDEHHLYATEDNYINSYTSLYPNGYPDYRQMDPKKRSLLVDD